MFCFQLGPNHMDYMKNDELSLYFHSADIRRPLHMGNKIGIKVQGFISGD